jgi:hypothetical protein
MHEESKTQLKPEEAEMLARFEKELRRMTVAEHLVTMMQSLAALAVRKLGATPETAAERDLQQAKLAIEAFRALLTLVEPTRPEGEIRGHRQVLSELQLAYVQALEHPEPASADPGSAG